MPSSNRAKRGLAGFFRLAKNAKDSFSSKKGDGFNNKQTELDQKLIYSLSKSKIPNFRQLKYIKKFLNSKELKIIQLCLAIILISVIFMGINFHKKNVQVVPIVGGEYTEGLIGTPKYINPLYAPANDVGGNISRLVFSSLLKRNSQGELINDLATEYSISEDNKSYTIKIRNDVKWHNDEPLTVNDIVFTFNAISEPKYKSPLRLSFSGVNIEKVDDTTIKFNLAEPYAAFLELLTFGIIPQDLWLHIEPESANLAELNLKPIGSGPYKFKSLVKDRSGNIRSYNLERNENYNGQKPYLKELHFKFFINTTEAVNALNNNDIDGIDYLPREAKADLVAQDSLNFYNLTLPQINAIFFNEANNVALKDKRVRQALATAINKNKIISEIFSGNAHVIDGPILPNNFAYNEEINKHKFNLEEANKFLDDAGWQMSEVNLEEITQAEIDISAEDEATKETAEIKLSLGVGNWRKKGNDYLIINLTTVETDDNMSVAVLIKTFWEEIGVKTNLNIVAISQIQPDIIKPRNFESLLYGQIVGNDPDSYVLWHSSQIGENGLNISNFNNKEVDELLEDARLISNIEDRITKYKKFQEIITNNLPAIFLYSPTYTYVQSKKINGFNIKNILIPSDRFSNIEEWYIKTGKKIIW